jgi:hypothetical protein
VLCIDDTCILVIADSLVEKPSDPCQSDAMVRQVRPNYSVR